MNAETGVTLSEADLEAGEAYYTQHGWSGCAGSAWSTLTPGTKDGWRHAESQFSRAEKAEAALAEAEQKGAREARAAGWDRAHDSVCTHKSWGGQCYAAGHVNPYRAAQVGGDS